MRDINSYIAKNIILAQVASDGGKRIRSEFRDEVSELFKEANKNWAYGYYHKNSLILKAIKLISSYKTNFYYNVMYSHCNRNDIDVYIAYFNFKIDGKRYQVSFHMYAEDAESIKLLDNLSNKSSRFRTRWDRKKSIEACSALLDTLK